MRVYMFIIRSAVIASLVLISWVLAPSVLAQDQPAGTGTPAQMETQKGTTVEKADIQRTSPETRELGKGSEIPMKVPDSGEFSHLQSTIHLGPDSHDVEITREQDLRSSTSY